MKYLSDYTEEGISKALEEFGGFYAFSTKQFNEAKKEGVKYVSLGAGLICPEDNALQLVNAIMAVGNNGIQQDLAENGKEAIIRRELYNHEAFYTGDIESTVDALQNYPITEEEVRDVFRKERVKAQA